MFTMAGNEGPKEEAARPPTDWERYNPVHDFDEVIEPNPIPNFTALENGLVVIASSSPRIGRCLKVLGEKQKAKLSGKEMLDLLEQAKQKMKKDGRLIPEYEAIFKAIAEYEEPKRSWRLTETEEASDGGLSLEKARITAAATLLIEEAQNRSLPEQFAVIAKDFNLVNCEFEFLDKPWLRSKDAKLKAFAPIDQMLMLYCPQHYYRLMESYDVVREAIQAKDFEVAIAILEAKEKHRGGLADEDSRLLAKVKAAQADPEADSALAGERTAIHPYEPERARFIAGLAESGKFENVPDDAVFPFYVANSTTLLSLNFQGRPNVSLEELKQLVDLKASLPDFAKAKTALSFLAVQPDSADIIGEEMINKKKLTVFNLFDYYMDWIGGFKGNPLYKRPGFVDWARPPFSEHLLIFEGPEGCIFDSVSQMRTAEQEGHGEWKKYPEAAAADNQLEDEMVGAPIYSLEKLLKSERSIPGINGSK